MFLIYLIVTEDRTRLYKITEKIISMSIHALVVVFCVGEWVPCSVGGNFTPHVITVNAGEVNSSEVFYLIDHK